MTKRAFYTYKFYGWGECYANFYTKQGNCCNFLYTVYLSQRLVNELRQCRALTVGHEILKEVRHRQLQFFSEVSKDYKYVKSQRPDPVNIFRSSTFSRKCQSSYFRFLRWSLQYGRRWLQFPNNRCAIQSIFVISAHKGH